MTACIAYNEPLLNSTAQEYLLNIQEKMAAIIQSEADAIARIKVTDDFENAVNMVMQNTGNVITTGIGKAGYVAQRFAATLSSTGTSAFFIHPAEAGHGDMGMLSDQDIIIALSTSGKSIEVIEMLEIAAQLGVDAVIGITSHTDSPLRALSKVILDMGPDIEEPCPLKLTPSATIAVMSAICDAIALTLLELKGFTSQDYGRRHHKGYLGAISRAPHHYDSQDNN